MDGRSELLTRLLDQIFESGHDIAIIGSPVPRRSRLDCTIPDAPNFGCDIEFVTSALDSLYNIYERRGEEQEGSLRESVKRILRWKYDMYANLVPTLTPTTFLEGTTVYEPAATREQRVITHELANLSGEVFRNAISIVTSPNSRDPKDLKDLRLDELSRVLCVGPTYED